MATTEPELPWLGPLLQFSSANLPVGAYIYSQGLEWAIEAHWVHDVDSLTAWCRDWIAGPIALQDLPLLQRLHLAFSEGDGEAIAHWSQWALACRETHELREEERTRARAVFSLLKRLLPDAVQSHQSALLSTPLAGLACASVALGMPLHGAQTAHAWGWLENTVLVGVKHIPIGQSDGQHILMTLWPAVQHALATSETVADDDIGCSLPAASFASAAHETQYTRLYRS
ncbi:MAG: urease accessory UreF family protein [Pseudomonadota bacterium]